MARGKSLKDEEGSNKGTSLHVIVEKLSRHIDTVRRFLSDASTKKKRSDCGSSKTVTATYLWNIRRM